MTDPNGDLARRVHDREILEDRERRRGSLLVRGCHAWIGPSLPVREDVDLLAVGGLIADMQPSGTRPPPADAVVLEGRGLLALPGLSTPTPIHGERAPRRGGGADP
jgi:hypothetical protein